MESERSFKLKDAIKELEGIVEKLNDPETDIDEAINLFQRGQELVKMSLKKLNEAKMKIESLMNIEEVLNGSEPEFEEIPEEELLPPEYQ